MEDKTVESDDLRLRQKVLELRANLFDRQQRYHKKRRATHGIKVLTLMLAIATIGYYLTVATAFRDQPYIPAASKAQGPSAPVAATPEAEPPVKVPASDTTLWKKAQTAVVAAAESEPERPVEPPRRRTRIAQSLTCLDVEARQCIGNQSVFALSQHNNPHVWMEVHSQALPYVIKHVYYHEGRKYAEVPLAIKYSRMRTWSNITLRSPVYVGSWWVEIVTEDGTVLGQLRFQVTP